MATGISWLAYFKALQLAPASMVAPLDKLSLPLTVLLAAVVLGETLTWKSGLRRGADGRRSDRRHAALTDSGFTQDPEIGSALRLQFRELLSMDLTHARRRNRL